MNGETELTRDDLREAMRARKVADERYRQLICLAKERGWSNTEIARAVGLSEAAIRLYWKRSGRQEVVAIRSEMSTRELVG
jgi:DNA-directed RNA polymerase specialized sigma24 family protein